MTETATQQPAILAALSLMLALVILFVSLRVIARAKYGPGLWWDDYLTLFALCLSIAADAVLYFEVSLGLGKHESSASDANFETLLRAFYVAERIYNLALGCMKVSVLLCHKRIFPTRYMKWVFYILVTISATWCIAIQFVLVFQCIPVQSLWDQTIKGTCFNRSAFFLAQGIPHVLTDAAILVSPLYPVWQLHMKVYQKVALTGVFLTGGCAVIFSIVRLIVVYELPNNSPDITWTWVPTYMWTIADMHLALISACLVCLGPLLKALKAKLSSSTVEAYPTHRNGKYPLQKQGRSYPSTQNGPLHTRTVPGGFSERSYFARLQDTDEHELLPLPSDAAASSTRFGGKGDSNQNYAEESVTAIPHWVDVEVSKGLAKT